MKTITWTIMIVFPLLAGCASGAKRLAFQQEVQKIIADGAEFQPVQEPRYNDKAEKLSETLLNLTPRSNFSWYKKYSKTMYASDLYFPAFSDKYVLVSKIERITELPKLKGYAELLKNAGYGKDSEVHSLFLKNIESGNYTRLIPQGYSLTSTSILKENKFIAHHSLMVAPDGSAFAYTAAPDYKLYLQPLAKKQARVALSEGSSLSLVPWSREYNAFQASMPKYEFSPDGQYLAILEEGILSLRSLNTGKEETIVAGPKLSADFSSNGHYLIYSGDGVTYFAYNLNSNKKMAIPLDNVLIQVKEGVGIGGKLGDIGKNLGTTMLGIALGGSSTKTKRKERSYYISDISPDGKYALVSVLVVIETKTTRGGGGFFGKTRTSPNLPSRSPIPWGGGSSGKTRTSPDVNTGSGFHIEPEKNMILDLNTGDVRNLFGYGGEGHAAEKLSFLPDGSLCYDRGDGKEMKIYKISYEDLFRTPAQKAEKVVENGEMKLGFKVEGFMKSFSSDGKYLAWCRGNNVYYSRMGGDKSERIKAAYLPKFSPDGKYLYYVGRDDYNLYRLTLP